MPAMHFCEQVHAVEAMCGNILGMFAVSGVSGQVRTMFQGAPWLLACSMNRHIVLFVNKHSCN